MRLPVLLAVVLLAGCLGGGSKAPAATPTPTEPWFAFGAPVVPTPAADGYGSEPSILAAKDGAVYVASVLGSATARGDGVWKSKDAGATWSYLGKVDYPFGGGDTDIDEDGAGTLYVPGQWRPAAPPVNCYVTGGESMAVSKDHGATWTVNPVASDVPIVDRQWTGTYGTGTAYLVFNQAQRGLTITKSVDSGATWSPPLVVANTWTSGGSLPCGDPLPAPATQGGPNGIPGDVVVDPHDGSIYVPYAGQSHRVFVSHDAGLTFAPHEVRRVPLDEQPNAIFSTLAMDSSGGLYYAWTETMEHSTTMAVLLALSTDHGVHWSAPLRVSPAGTSAIFPWIVAGAPGHVAVGYYGATGDFKSDDAPKDTPWYPVLALARNAVGPNTTFELATLSAVPTHKGPICTGGTACDPAYRTLGDFFEVGLTKDGRVVAVWADDTGAARVNAVAVQTRGSLL